MQNSPLKIFIAFAKEDLDLRDKLLRQMNLVKTREGWDIWASHEINAGAVWNEEIKARLAESEVVVLLMSSSFFNSKYILETELPAIVEKHRAGNCHIVPVLARHCLWKDTSFGDYAELGDIQALPGGEKPIVSKGNWDSEEEPYVETVQGLKLAIQGFKDKLTKQEELKKTEQLRIKYEIAQKEAEAAERLAQLAHQQRENEDHAAFRNAVRIAGLEHYLRQGFTIHAAEAREILRDLRAEQARNEKEAAQKQQRAEAQRLKKEAAERKAQKQKVDGEKKPFPVRKVTMIVCGVLGLVLIWFLWRQLGQMIKSEKTDDDLTQNQTQSIEKPWTDTSRISKSIAPEKLRENIGIKKEESPTDFKDPFDGLMIQVKGGTFLMGSPLSEPGRSEDECQHSVVVKSFKIGKYEVTQNQWQTIMGSTPVQFEKNPKFPIVNISWDDTQIFLKKLNKKTGKNYRLPTEAEWEYAAKGGINNKGYIYAGSNNLGEVAWFSGNSNQNMKKVGYKLPNELGLYDMSGSVWEWCQDLYNPFNECFGTESSSHVLKGGSFDSIKEWARNSTRGKINRGGYVDYKGLRIARD